MHRDYLYRCKKIIRNFNSKHIQIIEGGAERFISVSNALKFVNSEFVCIHDGVRPFVTEKLIVNTIIETTKANNAGCICCIDIKDTIKVVDKEKFFINNTIDRNKMFAAQTPQTFRSVLIKKAYKLACKDLFYGTDDASFLERYGYKVKFIYGDCFNIKITTPDDIIFARIYLESLKLK
jgi:2-C-methyl-D-erythritol 4-phosphate cytidylyltransferase